MESPNNNSLPIFNIFAFGSSLVLFFGIVLHNGLDPDGFARLLAKDHVAKDHLSAETVVETLTFLVLIPAILSGLYAFKVYRERLPHPILGYWVLLCSVACIYFAGEEVSWGQRYFNWETQEFMAALNDQKEACQQNLWVKSGSGRSPSE